MIKQLFKSFLLYLTVLFIILTPLQHIDAKVSEPIIINNDTKKENMYPFIDLIKDRKRTITIDDVVPQGQFNDQFLQSNNIRQKRGFFERANWIRFEIVNESDERDWLLEFAFPLIHELDVFIEEDGQVKQLYQLGADYPFHERVIEHRHLVFNLEIEQGTSKTFYILAVGSGDLHPPIILWDKDTYIEKSVNEFILLGIFYGIIFVMIIYNLFLFFGLRMRSYLYYVFMIIFTLLGKLSINGIAYQYIWPNSPKFNLIAAPIWVPIACMFVLVFSRSFLDIDRYIPSFRWAFYLLLILNGLIIVTLLFSRYVALYFMIIFSITTFFVTLTVAVICLIRGARQARFYLLGWCIFLTGVSLTLLERAVVIPYSLITEYAGQAALTIEVVLLSLALADKINIIRKEKQLAEKESKEHQELALKNLQKADKLKDEFLAITSHELRTPLYGMIGIAESLQDGVSGKVSQNMKQQLSMIVKSGQRLTYLVDEILDFSKLKYDSLDLELKPVYINSVINIVLAISKPLIKDKPIKLINNVTQSLPPVLADENRLQQIFHNLIDNAIKYTEQGEVTITATTQNEFIIVKVSDTGQGISEEQLDIIFQPFQQGAESTSRDSSGVGIGLNIAQDLIKLHNGKLHVSSEVGKGSTFEVTFPIHKHISVNDKVAVTIEDNTNEQHELIYIDNRKYNNESKILVADDEIVNLQVLTNQLSLKGYDVLTTLNGENVFNILNEHDIDLLILDIMMPGMSGYDVCLQLRKSYSLMDLPILMLTAKNQVQDKMLAFEAGANDYLVKPCDKQELLSRVKTLIKVKTLNKQLIEANISLEDKVLERTSKLKVANKNLKQIENSRRQMLANIAHELGTPVTLIHNYVQSIQKGLIKKDDIRYQELVTDKINVLNRLIEDLFDLSMLEAGKIKFNKKRTNLLSWLNKLYNKYEFTVIHNDRKFERSTLNVKFKQYVCFIDEARIDQLFSNLIENAIKHTKNDTGKIFISSKIINKNFILIQIIDNGVGINEKDLPFIFERFYKNNESNNNQVGTGLGLAIAKQIVINHHGNISVNSERNKGTTFSITLPVTSEN